MGVEGLKNEAGVVGNGANLLAHVGADGVVGGALSEESGAWGVDGVGGGGGAGGGGHSGHGGGLGDDDGGDATGERGVSVNARD